MQNPKLSLGLPVYNGENYLEKCLQSILGQTYTDFELIICDNCSEDGTRAICEHYAATDSRVRYIRNETNVGAAENFNRAVRLARGEYFKWVAHDDLYVDTFLAACIGVLEASPDVLLAFTKVCQIDDNDEILEYSKYRLADVASPSPRARFSAVVMNRHGCESIFGVIRLEALRQTPLIGHFVASDLVLLAELSLTGRFGEVPEFLFLHREHATRSVRGESHEVAEWFSPKLHGGVVFPLWRVLREYLRIVLLANLNMTERLGCLKTVAAWVRARPIPLKNEVSSGVERFLDLNSKSRVYRLIQRLDHVPRLPGFLITATKIVAIALTSIVIVLMRFVTRPPPEVADSQHTDANRS